MTDYLLGIKRMNRWFETQRDDLPSDKFITFTNLRTALVESIDDENKLGGLIGPVEKTERRRILSGLNVLALELIGAPFIDLSQPGYDFELEKHDDESHGGADRKQERPNNIQLFILGNYISKGVDQRYQHVSGPQTNITGDAKGPLASGEFNSTTTFGEENVRDNQKNNASEKDNEGG